MKVLNTTLRGVLKIEPPTIFNDFRGEYVETYNKKIYFDSGIKINFLQDDISLSKKNVLRGIHGDNDTWKLVSCLWGSLFLVVVNNNIHSDEYLKWESFNLNDKERIQILIPPKFGNGHLVTSEYAIFNYKQSQYYSRKSQFTILWNDSRLRIKWPIEEPELSERDRGNDA